jgi:serine/threonine protein kinase
LDQVVWLSPIFRRNQLAHPESSRANITYGCSDFAITAAIIFASHSEGVYNFPSPFWDTISDSAKDIVTKLLKVKPAERLSVDDALAHPFLQVEPGIGMVLVATDIARLLSCAGC